MDGIASLNRLLDRLEKQGREIERELDSRYGRGVADFPRSISDWQQFRWAVGRFAAYVGHGLDAKEYQEEGDHTADIMYFEMVWPHAAQPLGDRTQGMATWKIFHRELEGGHREILNKLFDACVTWIKTSRTEGAIREFVGEYEKLEWEDQCRVCEAYYSRYGRLLPADVRGELAQVRAFNFKQMLAKHVAMMENVRQAGRRMG